ncbi:MAG TPA: hypothetical protein VJ228_02165 [Candidatus Acidoferrales bacterium]|nr:hypothetical protein [Candidatus Acidoferrales bacterium]
MLPDWSKPKSNGQLAEALTIEKKAVALDPDNADLQAQFAKFKAAAVVASFRTLPKTW